jgi:hypothetical protein
VDLGEYLEAKLQSGIDAGGIGNVRSVIGRRPSYRSRERAESHFLLYRSVADR